MTAMRMTAPDDRAENGFVAQLFRNFADGD
jgi:hypothetical protein